jgi:hypothetical protein
MRFIPHKSPLRLAIAGLAMALLAASPAAAQEPTAEARRARTVARALEAGNVAEGLLEAEAALKLFPESPLLHRRLAQASFCRAMELDRAFQEVLQDAVFEAALGKGVRSLADPQASAYITARDAHRRELLRLLAAGDVAAFRQDARNRVEGCADLLDERTRALSRSRSALNEARRLGDPAAELDLTELWTEVAVLLWREQPGLVRQLEQSAPVDERSSIGEAAAKAIASFENITRASTLQRAVALAERGASDPVALAGAADVLALLAGLGAKPDALAAHVMARLERRYVRGGGQEPFAVAVAARTAAHRLYADALAEGEIDAAAAPTAAALRLYAKALKLDADRRLPYLPLRVYTLTAAFDRERAVEVLDELDRRRPGNAAVSLERARAALLLDDKPEAGLAHLREAARRREFSRSCFAAVPSTLRPALRLHRGLSEVCETTWPGYHRLFQTLIETGRAQREDASRAEVALLRLNVADRLCAAPDYADLTCGVDQKTGALTALLGLGERLPPEQRAGLEARLADHGRAFASFPGKRMMMSVSPDGLRTTRYPAVGRQGMRNPAPLMLILSAGILTISLGDG